MYIWEKQKSMFGGLFQTDEQVIKYLPHKITPEDATMLMEFFDIVALSKYDMYLRVFINSTFPNPPKASEFQLPTFLE